MRMGHSAPENWIRSSGADVPYAKYCGLNTKDSADLNSFPDAGKVSGFSREAMVGAGLVQGDQGTLNPQGNA